MPSLEQRRIMRGLAGFQCTCQFRRIWLHPAPSGGNQINSWRTVWSLWKAAWRKQTVLLPMKFGGDFFFILFYFLIQSNLYYLVSFGGKGEQPEAKGGENSYYQGKKCNFLNYKVVNMLYFMNMCFYHFQHQKYQIAKWIFGFWLSHTWVWGELCHISLFL